MRHQIRHQAAPSDRIGSAIQFLFENRRVLAPVATAAAGAAGGALASKKGRRLRGAVIGGVTGGVGGLAYQNRDWIKGIIANALKKLKKDKTWKGPEDPVQAAQRPDPALGDAAVTAETRAADEESRRVKDAEDAASLAASEQADLSLQKQDTSARMEAQRTSSEVADNDALRAKQDAEDAAKDEAAWAASKQQSLEDWYQYVKQQNEGKADTTSRMQGMEQEASARVAAEKEAEAQAAWDRLPARLGKGPGDVSTLERALARGADTPNLYRLFANPIGRKYQEITKGAAEAYTGAGIMAGEAADALTNAARTGVTTGAEGLVGASETAGKLARAARPSVLVGAAGNKVINPVLAAILNAYNYPTKNARLRATMTNTLVKPEDLPSWGAGWRRYVLSPGLANLGEAAVEAAVKQQGQNGGDTANPLARPPWENQPGMPLFP